MEAIARLKTISKSVLLRKICASSLSSKRHDNILPQDNYMTSIWRSNFSCSEPISLQNIVKSLEFNDWFYKMYYIWLKFFVLTALVITVLFFFNFIGSNIHILYMFLSGFYIWRGFWYLMNLSFNNTFIITIHRLIENVSISMF